MITIFDIVKRFKTLQEADSRIHSFGCGPKYDIQDDIEYYPYLWLINDIPHDLTYSDVNKYRSVEYNFILRVGDKVNNQNGYTNYYGLDGTNNLQIISECFVIITDLINAISEDSLGIFTDLGLINDISIDPFHNDDSGNVSGFEAQITLRTKNNNVCYSPITDI